MPALQLVVVMLKEWLISKALHRHALDVCPESADESCLLSVKRARKELILIGHARAYREMLR